MCRSTIQEAFERALGKVFRDDGPFHFAPSGRTDAGVHALDQHLQFFTARPWLGKPVLQRGGDDARRMVLALNSNLPPTIRCFEVYQTAPDFSVRFDAVAKTYYYYINNFFSQSPFLHQRRLHHPRDLDLDRVAETWSCFEGQHNFWHFSTSSPDGVTRNPVRFMSRCKVERIEGGACLQVTGTGFLYRQVRHMVGASLACGTGKLEVARVRELLTADPATCRDGPRNVKPEWQVADASGLYLRSVLYAEGHDQPCSFYHPEFYHLPNGRVNGALQLADERFGVEIERVRRQLMVASPTDHACKS